MIYRTLVIVFFSLSTNTGEVSDLEEGVIGLKHHLYDFAAKDLNLKNEKYAQ